MMPREDSNSKLTYYSSHQKGCNRCVGYKGWFHKHLLGHFLLIDFQPPTRCSPTKITSSCGLLLGNEVVQQCLTTG